MLKLEHFFLCCADNRLGEAVVAHIFENRANRIQYKIGRKNIIKILGCDFDAVGVFQIIELDFPDAVYQLSVFLCDFIPCRNTVSSAVLHIAILL